jgi:hypothetical protein
MYSQISKCLASKRKKDKISGPINSFRGSSDDQCINLLLHTDQVGSSTASSSSLTSLPTTFTDNQRKLRIWLEQVEQSLLNDKVRVVDLQTIDGKKKMYKDLLDQTYEQEHLMEQLNINAKESYKKN